MQTGNLTYLYRRTHLLLRRPGFLSSFPRNHSFKPETSQNVLPNTKKSISSVNNRTQISPLSCLITTITILICNLKASNRNNLVLRVKLDISEFEWTLNVTRRRRARVPSRDLAPDRVLDVHDNASDRRRATRP